MQPRCTIVTLGVRDLERARRFYVDGLGWPVEVDVPGQGIYLRWGSGQLLCLFDVAQLAAEVGGTQVDPGGAVVLGHNVASDKEVMEALEAVRVLGATVLSSGQSREWGGFSGFFADLDGYRWEVAHNPGLLVGEDGSVTLIAPAGD